MTSLHILFCHVLERMNRKEHEKNDSFNSFSPKWTIDFKMSYKTSKLCNKRKREKEIAQMQTVSKRQEFNVHVLNLL
jgi:hypothetical protein